MPKKSSPPTTVKVAVRCRPLLPKEILAKSSSCVRIDQKDRQIIMGKKAFRYDYVFDSQKKQQHVYETCAQRLVGQVFNGFNSTIFAYGQTGSGKTHTMTGSMSRQDSNMGIIPRAIKDIFNRAEDLKDKFDFMMRVSYMEIYKEGLRDLLEPKNKNLVIREDQQKGIIVVGVKEQVVESYDDMQQCLEDGALNRTTGSTQMNEHSSRSHSIFTIHLEKRAKQETEEQAYTTAKFHLVDLAGSERNKRTGAVGLRFKEAIQINSGLLALGNVISALGDEKKRKYVKHVPYRESKLTRLLTDSLGGNSQTLMIACISPADTNFEETLNTLKYSNRARNIRQKPIQNFDPHQAELARMKMQIKKLQEQLVSSRNPSAFPNDGTAISQQYISTLSAVTNEELSIIKEQNVLLNTEVVKVKDELTSANDTISELSENLFLVKNTRDKFQRRLQEGLIQLKQTVRSLKSVCQQTKMTPKMSQEISNLIQRLEQWCQREDRDHENSHTIPEELNQLLQKSTNQLSGSKVSQDLPADQVISKQQVYIKQLEDELKEARGDLFRDEQIFSDKIKEIKTLKKQLLEIAKEKEEMAVKANQSIFERELDRDPFQRRDLSAGNGNGQLGTGTGNVHLGTGNDQLGTGNGQLGTGTDNVQPQQNNFVGNNFVGSPGQNQGKLFFNVAKDTKENNRYNLSEFGSTSGSIAPPPMTPTSKTTIAQMKKNIEELTEQKIELLKEKKQTEEEKAILEEQATIERHEHDKEQDKLKTNLNNLTIMIHLKQELIQDLVKKGNESKVTESEYQNRIEQMEKEVQESNLELQKAIGQISEKAKEARLKEHQKGLIKKKYDEKVAVLRQEISHLKKRHNKERKLKKQQAESKKRVKELENEVQRMKQQKLILKEKIKVEAAKIEEKQAKKIKQIASLRRDAQNSLKKIKELESQNQRQKKILMRKSEQLKSFQRQLTKFAQQEKERKRTKHQRAWLDREADAYMRRKEKIEKLEKELARREEIIAKREATIARKEKIRKRQYKKKMAIEQSIIGLGKELEGLEKHLKDLDESDVPGIEAFQQKIKMVLKQKKNLESKKQQEKYKEEEEMRQLDDMTEVLEAEIEYKTEAIEQAKEAIQKDDPSEMINSIQLFSKINDINEAKDLLGSYFRKIIDLKEAEQKKEASYKEVQMNFEESKKVIDNLTNNIRLTKAVSEKKISNQKKEFDLAIQRYVAEIEKQKKVMEGQKSMMVDAHEKEKKIQELEKDVWYLRKRLHTQRTKYSKLKQQQENNVSTSMSITSSEQEDPSIRISKLAEENRKLKDQMKNLKGFITKHYSGGIVRKSIMDVKEIAANELPSRSKK